jgi:RNA polymerase subunit RPABC4/transcription elongation factor Spt4
LAEIPDGERIKSCLACDALIPFKAEVCPRCSSSQEAPRASRPCPSCSTALESKALFCPKCDKLTVPTTRIPIVKASQAPKRPISGRSVGLALNALELAAAAVLVFVVIDHILN